MTTSENKFTFVKLDEKASEHIAAPKYSYWKSVFKKFFSSKVAIFLLIILAGMVIMSLIHPLISGYSPLNAPNINNPSTWYNPPSAQLWFGTDNVGNSLFDAIWVGTRNSLMIAVVATAISTVIGVLVGMFWGYSKKMDAIMLNVYNVVANIPYLLLVIVLMYVLGRGIWQMIFSLSCTSWLSTAYFIRVQVMIIRDREYNLASECLGTPRTKVIFHNIFPYLISVIMTSLARDIPSFISYEVFLTYVGNGLSEKEASLGRMIQKYSAYMTSSPYLFWIPVAFSAIISVSIYVVGQTLADASDPRTHMV